MAIATPIVSQKPSVDSTTVALADDNSLVNGRLDHDAWVVSRPIMAPLRRAFAGDSAITLTRSLIYVGFDNASPAGAYLERPFTVPTGVTGVAIELDEVLLPSSVASSVAFSLDLLDATGVTVLGTVSVTPTSTLTNAATATITVTPGVEYRVRVTVGAARFRCGMLRVRPVTVDSATAGIFARPFRRIDVHGTLQDNTETVWRNPRFPPQNGHVFVDVMTDAATLVVEVYSNIGDFVGTAASGITPQLGRMPTAAIIPTIGATSYLSVTTRGRDVRLAPGLAAETGYVAPVTEPRGTNLAAVYVPISAYVSVVQAPIEVVVISGDSKFAGSYADLPGGDSWAYTLRRAFYRVINTATGGQTLVQNVGGTISQAACTAWAMKLCRHRPTKIFLGIGRNDWTVSAYTAANLVTQIGNLADAIHAVSPSTQVVLVTWTSETTENAIATVAWDTERGNIRALATSRSPWCTVLDAARYWTPAEAIQYTTDNVHPNSAGYAALCIGAVGYQHPWTPNRGSPTIWCEASAIGLQSGANMSAVTAVSGGGATNPTVTLTGTPAVVCRLLIEIKIGGARGVARFRWSIDGGRSWLPGNGQTILTAATVLLAPIGVTVNFGNDANYDNLMYYHAETCPGAWTDLSGGGNDLVQATASQRLRWVQSATGLKPTLQCTVGSLTFVRRTGLNIPAPYTFAVVGQLTDQASLRAIVGRFASGTAPILFSSSATQMTLNAGGLQFAATVAATNPHVYVCVVDGAASSLRVDGVATAGTLGANTITDLLIGFDGAAAWPWDKWISAFALYPRALSASECLALEARWRREYGTP